MNTDSDSLSRQSRDVSDRPGPAWSGSEIVEVNFDGLVGPTHNYAGLSRGNLASEKHADTRSHPKQAALQGLAKMKLLMELGVPQAVIPPQLRPNLQSLRSLGFAGSDADAVARAGRDAPKLLAAIYSSSFMWAANAATVSPAADCVDGRTHLTPANLITQFHRSIEPFDTAETLRRIFSGQTFCHHEPLPAASALADEGAANHLRLCGSHGQSGVEIFVYGRDESAGERSTGPRRFPARQTLQACQAIARRHQLDPARTMFIRQSAEAIDAGAFHNDVVAASNQNVLLVHRQAFANDSAISQIMQTFGQPLWTFVAEPDELSLADAVTSYIFNSQIVTLPDATMAIVAPLECREHAGVQQYLSRILSSDCPVKSVHYVDLRQSMHNGGGPACLRLRVVMRVDAAQPLLLTAAAIAQLESIIHRRYRDVLSLQNLTDPHLIVEAQDAVEEIQRALSP